MQQVIFQLYSIKSYIKTREGVGQRLLTAADKGLESCVGTKHLVFCSCYNSPTLLRNLQKWSLMWHSLNTLSTMGHGQAFLIMTWIPPYPPYGDTLSSSVEMIHGN